MRVGAPVICTGDVYHLLYRIRTQILVQNFCYFSLMFNGFVNGIFH